MLVLTRTTKKDGIILQCGDQRIELRVFPVGENSAKVGITADKNVHIRRAELEEKSNGS